MASIGALGLTAGSLLCLRWSEISRLASPLSAESFFLSDSRFAGFNLLRTGGYRELGRVTNLLVCVR